MTISESLKLQIHKAALEAFPGLELSVDDISIEHPSSESHGDYSTNLALKLKLGNPKEVAQKISANLKNSTVAGPGFINITLDEKTLLNELQEILTKADEYGSSNLGQGKTVVIDYSAPNIAKRFGIGHLRSTIIGQALYNLYKFQGYKVIGDNHLGDWGTQFGKIMYMIDTEKPKELTVDILEDLYVRFHEMAEKDPNLDEKGREWFKKLESGDKEAKKLWQECIDISLKEFNRIYDLLNVKIDFAYGESFYQDKMSIVIKDAEEISTKSNGAQIIEIPNIKAPLILVKSDGATTYATRDLATLKFRKETWDPDVIIYEVGAEQTLHFNQLFAAAKMLGYVKENTELVHTKHGLYRWEHGKMKTRKGDTVKLEDILNEAISRAEKLGSKDTAKAVGIGAVKYLDLSHNVQSDIIFNWENMFNLQGDSGPYLQYTYARARSILRKIVGVDLCVNPGAHIGAPLQEESAILRYLYRFPEVIELAAKTYSPNLICTYLFELAKRFNNFYNNCPILTPDHPNLPYHPDRLSLTQAVSIILKNGLTLLGIEALEQM